MKTNYGFYELNKYYSNITANAVDCYESTSQTHS